MEQIMDTMRDAGSRVLAALCETGKAVAGFVTGVVKSVSCAVAGFVKDGTCKAMTYSTKRRMPKWTEERRKKQGDAIRASFTEERRQRMSETMKKVRRERYWHSTGKSKRSQQP